MKPITVLVPVNATAPAILALCHQLTPNESRAPSFVPNLVSTQSSAGNCFNNVAQHQANHGGSIQYGWCIWETPGILLQAEFHAVWKTPDGKLVDITPHNQNLRDGHILFLVDSVRVYEGVRVNNIRIPLLDAPIVTAYLDAQNALFAETQHYMNDQRQKLNTETQRHDAVQQVNKVLKQFEDSHLALERLIKKRFPRNDPCPCGSGLKAKKCCYP